MSEPAYKLLGAKEYMVCLTSFLRSGRSECSISLIFPQQYLDRLPKYGNHKL